MWRPVRSSVCHLAALMGWFILPAQPALASGFSVLFTPPRFELRAQPGEVVRQVVEVTNVAPTVTYLTVQTADWQFGEDGSVMFESALADDSCRPWTALEARQLEIGPNGRRRYRFEVAVPADAVERECRLAILFEGEPEMVGQLGLPVAGRIGIIVYVAVGRAAPRLEVRHSEFVVVEGKRLPALTVANTGQAHTRLEGFVNGRDASGREFVFVPQDSPVLPGHTRTVAFYPQDPAGQAPPEIHYPIRLAGRLEWSGNRLDIDEVFVAE